MSLWHTDAFFATPWYQVPGRSIIPLVPGTWYDGIPGTVPSTIVLGHGVSQVPVGPTVSCQQPSRICSLL